jgi:hypothetical protein
MQLAQLIRRHLGGEVTLELDGVLGVIGHAFS